MLQIRHYDSKAKHLEFLERFFCWSGVLLATHKSIKALNNMALNIWIYNIIWPSLQLIQKHWYHSKKMAKGLQRWKIIHWCCPACHTHFQWCRRNSSWARAECTLMSWARMHTHTTLGDRNLHCWDRLKTCRKNDISTHCLPTDTQRQYTYKFSHVEFEQSTTSSLAVASIARDVGSSSTNHSSDIMHFLPRLHERFICIYIL